MHRLKMVAAAILCASTALAQQPPAPALPTFSETVEVRVLNLDVDVTDAKGRNKRFTAEESIQSAVQ